MAYSEEGSPYGGRTCILSKIYIYCVFEKLGFLLIESFEKSGYIILVSGDFIKRLR
jgi:hypothetical protein